jgi:hypothetical protein
MLTFLIPTGLILPSTGIQNNHNAKFLQKQNHRFKIKPNYKDMPEEPRWGAFISGSNWDSNNLMNLFLEMVTHGKSPLL